jgi:SAM-dependent methyltransferase
VVFRSAHYARHNARRQEHLASLGLPLDGRTVLEVGAGVWDHTTFFLDRGCTVLSVEPRQENCELFHLTMRELRNAGYDKTERCTLLRCDVESMDRFLQDGFEIVYCYGLLYHVADPAAVLEVMARRCTNLLLLETCVSYGDDQAIHPTAEPQSASQAYHGTGCRPTRPWLFNKLKTLFPHVYVPRTQPAHEEFPLDWKHPPTHQSFTRAVFVAARQVLENPLLLDFLPDHQTR